jgi:hypothetical protein
MAGVFIRLFDLSIKSIPTGGIIFGILAIVSRMANAPGGVIAYCRVDRFSILHKSSPKKVSTGSVYLPWTRFNAKLEPQTGATLTQLK